MLHNYLLDITPSAASALNIVPLNSYLTQAIDIAFANAENENASASDIFSCALAEYSLKGKISSSWLEIFKSLLIDKESGLPLEYNKKYSEKLWQFNHWNQTTIHSIYVYWFLLSISDQFKNEVKSAVKMSQQLIQPSGFVYNPAVSETNLRTRMRSELFMGVCQAIEIQSNGTNQDDLKKIYSPALQSINDVKYISAEFFRQKSFQFLKLQNPYFPNYNELLKNCGLDYGFSDYDVNSKVDDYMGTAKRVNRDKSIFSPVITLMSETLTLEKNKNPSLISAYKYLSEKPNSLPHFVVRDIEYSFGPSITVIETLATVEILSKDLR